MKQKLLLTAFVCLLLAGCGKTSQVTFTTGEVMLTAEGPLFEGSNTVTGDYASQLSAFLERQGATAADVKEARLIRASLVATDSAGFSNVSQLTLSMAAEKVEMQEVGVLNPVPQGSQQVEFKLAETQTAIADFLKQPSITFVTDANLLQDSPSNLSFKALFEFQITLQQ